MSDPRHKPELGFLQIWNMCFGFLGIQFGFALQNANVSRIFQTLGAEMDQLPILWVAAPLTGLLVQPIIGYMSDRTWNRLGRRRPYFLWGAMATSVALIAMPNSPALWIAAGTLWVLDASINITMEPFRAFVGDMLPRRQRPTGYLTQSFFIGAGAVVASALPWALSNWFSVANVAEAGALPDSVRWSFYLGAAVLLAAVCWTVYSTREYPPETLASFTADEPEEEPGRSAGDGPAFRSRTVWLWSAGGAAGIVAVAALGADWQLYLLAGGALAYGVLQGIALGMERSARVANPYYEIFLNLRWMPETMRKLAWVQFFTWFGLFCMAIYAVPAVSVHHFGAQDTHSALYNQAANWVGVLYAAQNGAAMLAAVLIPWLIRPLGLVGAHQVNLVVGAVAMASFLVIDDPQWLLAPMLVMGLTWASIVSAPYALLANAIPAAKMGVFMGIFNFFIVIPQIVAAGLLGSVVERLFDGHAIYALALGGASMLLSAALLQRLAKDAP